jgi:hypothetical protein
MTAVVVIYSISTPWKGLNKVMKDSLPQKICFKEVKWVARFDFNNKYRTLTHTFYLMWEEDTEWVMWNACDITQRFTLD